MRLRWSSHATFRQEMASLFPATFQSPSSPCFSRCSRGMRTLRDARPFPPRFPPPSQIALTFSRRRATQGPQLRPGPAMTSLPSEPIGISFPKAGRTWVRSVLNKAGAPLTFTHAGNGSQGWELGRPFEGVPAEHATRPVLFLHRNPIDTAVSFFFQVTKKDFARGTLKYWQRWPRLWARGALPPEDVDAFVLHPTYGVEKICRFNRGWLDHVEARPDSRVVTYEGLRADPVPGFTDIVQWLGRPTDRVEMAIEAKSFAAMKARELSRPQHGGLDKRREEGARKARKGKIGGYADTLRPETVEAASAIAGRFGFPA
ncbi:hypothetical protein CNY89_03495 [Amaricoccus sp. HAR-UPW-R2A-40]|nr:hypothetical protein CNY89_03495 [Amaricoccus sp. HAR-UPW-R2A-40]